MSYTTYYNISRYTIHLSSLIWQIFFENVALFFTFTNIHKVIVIKFQSIVVIQVTLLPTQKATKKFFLVA